MYKCPNYTVRAYVLDVQPVSVASVLHDEDVLPWLGTIRRRVEGRGVRSPSVLEQLAPQLVVAAQRVPLAAD
jgi:hypothetical protein